MFKEATGWAVPQRADSEETRCQILETALALFRERGFDKPQFATLRAGPVSHSAPPITTSTARKPRQARRNFTVARPINEE